MGFNVKRGLLVIVAAMAMAGCGSDDGGGGGNDSGNSTATDTSPPAIVSSSPIKGATKIAVTSGIQISFNESLDASSINTTTVSLKNSIGNVSGSLTYDGPSKSITFRPSQTLKYDETYTLTIASLKDISGNAMSSTSISFQTYKNPASQQIDYNTQGIVGYWIHSYDANGFRTHTNRHSGAGADGIWLTDDDLVSYLVYTNDPNGNWTRQTGYNSPGLTVHG